MGILIARYRIFRTRRATPWDVLVCNGGCVDSRLLHNALPQSRRAFVEYRQKFNGQLVQHFEGNRFINIKKPVFALATLWNLNDESTRHYQTVLDEAQKQVELPQNWTICTLDGCKHRPPQLVYTGGTWWSGANCHNMTPLVTPSMTQHKSSNRK